MAAQLHAYRHAYDGGWWEVEHALPDVRLRAHVLGPYVSWREASVRPTMRRETAAAVVPLIVNFGPSYVLASPAHAPQSHASFTAGVYDTWVNVQGATAADAVQVNLTPLAARRVLGLPMTELANRACGVHDALGARGHRLVEQLGNALTFAHRAALLDAFLLERLTAAPALPRAVWHAVGTIAATHGQVRMSQLQHDTGWSAARLGAAVRDACGVTPKRLAGILRFEHAVQVARASRAATWSQIATACGYADHAHLTRAFAQFAGEPPTAWAARAALDGMPLE